ncbi:MAG TPA: hypothetical protein VFX60_10260 [Micromonospora sp.]|nr:hypothetical protein [Micromonospora sp.]
MTRPSDEFGSELRLLFTADLDRLDVDRARTTQLLGLYDLYLQAKVSRGAIGERAERLAAHHRVNFAKVDFID